jgi:putative transcriptional regulator
MKRNRILSEMRETAAGLVRTGVVEKQTMKEFDALALAPVRDLSPRQIRSIRTQSRMSQAVFAAVLNTSVSTVQKWEIGAKRPSGPSLKLLDVIQRKGIEAVA